MQDAEEGLAGPHHPHSPGPVRLRCLPKEGGDRQAEETHPKKEQARAGGSGSKEEGAGEQADRDRPDREPRAGPGPRSGSSPHPQAPGTGC